MRDYTVTRETTTVIKRTMTTPANWVDIMKMQSHVINEWNALHDRTGEPFDDVIWFEADEETVSVCYRKTTSAPVDNDPTPQRLSASVLAAKAEAWSEGYDAGSRDSYADHAHRAASGERLDDEHLTCNPYVVLP